jgi:replicative DNA helicase
MSEEIDKILETEAFYNTRLSNDELRRQAQKEEPRFLSILLRNQDCLMDAMAFGLKPGAKGHFWDLEARQMYSIIFEYYKKYHKVLTRTAVDSVMDTIDKVGKVKIDDEHRAKIRMYWDKIHSMEAPIEDYDLLKENINNRYVQWQAYEIFKEELERIVKSKSNQRDLVKEGREKLFKIDCMETDDYTVTMGMTEGLEKVKEYISNRRENPETSPAIMTGINAIDKIFNGFAVGSYTIITGMVNGGKTTLMFNIAFNMAKAGYGVVYVSLEKAAVPLFTRLLALHALVDYNRIKHGGKGGEKGLSDYYYNKLSNFSIIL